MMPHHPRQVTAQYRHRAACFNTTSTIVIHPLASACCTMVIRQTSLAHLRRSLLHLLQQNLATQSAATGSRSALDVLQGSCSLQHQDVSSTCLQQVSSYSTISESTLSQAHATQLCSFHSHQPINSSMVITRGARTSSKRKEDKAKVDTEQITINVFDKDQQAHLTPVAVVQALGKYIVGQEDAKKAVAVALRGRWRRHRVSDDLKQDIQPKNILMIGPTGCGKTEIARRLAKLADAPFVKVEATKFTEVGYHGRDVDSIIKDLIDASISLVKAKLRAQAKVALAAAVETRLVALLAASGAAGQDGGAAVASWAAAGHDPDKIPEALVPIRDKLRDGQFENHHVELEHRPQSGLEINLGGNQGAAIQSILGLFSQSSGSRKERRMTVAAARAVLEETETDRMFPAELVTKEAVRLAEQDGIVFIDEIDKVVNSSKHFQRSGDPSTDGVQRDLLPLIEGSTVNTKYGNVNTDHMLFICSGAFHSAKPSDMMAELQGRLPIRVELKALTRDDFYRILTEPQYNLIKQQQMLLQTEGVDLHFTDAAIREMARLAEDINRATENIGARRLASLLERCVESISFSAPELAKQARNEGKERYHVVVDKEDIQEKVAVFMNKQDLAKWVL